VSVGAQTADRVIRLLLAVARSSEPLGITDLSRVTGFERAAVHRLIQPLLEHGFVTRESRGKRYVLGPGLIEMWALGMGKFGLRDHARGALERVAATTTETVSLHIRDDLHRICIDVVEGAHPVRRVVPVGERLPLYSGPTGKAMLAFLPEETIGAALTAGAAEGVDPVHARSDLEDARANGYLALVGDRVAGVGGLSVPVFDASGVVAVVTASGPARRFDEETMAEFAPYVRAECASISTVLGYTRVVGAAV
jgi:DNA-binding IclR family transcriptional regulator